MQQQGLLWINHAHQDGTNGAYGSRYLGRHRLDRSDIVRDGRLLDTPNRRGNELRHYSSFGSNRHHDHHDHHHYHPYRRNDRGYLPNEFKKEKPPTFDGDVKKSEDVEAWILGMNKLFELHKYTNNMKAIIVIFSLKGKENIWW